MAMRIDAGDGPHDCEDDPLCGWFGHGEVAIALAPLRRGAAEVGTPEVVIGECVRGVRAIAPDDVVGGVDDTVVVEVAGDGRERRR